MYILSIPAKWYACILNLADIFFFDLYPLLLFWQFNIVSSILHDNSLNELKLCFGFSCSNIFTIFYYHISFYLDNLRDFVSLPLRRVVTTPNELQAKSWKKFIHLDAFLTVITITASFK